MSARDYKYCPMCKHDLSYIVDESKEGYQICDKQTGGCDWIHYDSAALAMVMVVPLPRGELFTDITGTKGFGFGITTPEDSGLVIVTRGVLPQVGGRAFSSGYTKRREIPKVAAIRELEEEVGITGMVEDIKHLNRPSPMINVYTAVCLVRAEGFSKDNLEDVLRPGDDVIEVSIHTKDTLPDFCFDSHARYAQNWYNGVYGPLTGQNH